MARHEFAQLLNGELDRVGAPLDHKRTTWVHDELKDKGVQLVSREQVRKWLKGIDIPDQANLWLVCKRLKLNWHRLQPGAVGAPDVSMSNELQAVVEALSEDKRRDVLRYARLLLLEANNNKAGTEGSTSEVEPALLQRHRRL